MYSASAHVCVILSRTKRASFGPQELLILLRIKDVCTVSLPKDRFIVQWLLKVLNTSYAYIYIPSFRKRIAAILYRNVPHLFMANRSMSLREEFLIHNESIIELFSKYDLARSRILISFINLHDNFTKQVIYVHAQDMQLQTSIKKPLRLDTYFMRIQGV